jgi:integrase/recombinase XerD
VAGYIRHLRETSSSSTLLNRLQALSDALRVLAPGEDRGWLLELCRAARRRARPVREKRARLRPVGDLVALGERLMAAAETTARVSPRRRAAHYRDGLMIALLAYRPVRKKNFAAMRVGVHLVEEHGRYWMRFSAAETKNRVAYEAVFPQALEDKLDRYLSHHWPILVAGERGAPRSGIDALWVSEAGIPMSMGTMANRIEERTKAAFGQSIPPHWFRDVAATSIAIDNPVHVRDAQHVLGHADPTTTEKHYIQARSLQASRRHHAMLADLLRKGRRSSET